MNKIFYLLKIRLIGIEPEISRRFVVPDNITLDRLHDVIQIVMGWHDYHLYEFVINNKRYTEDPEMEEQGEECAKFRLMDLIKQNGRTFNYLYDFGDNWMHEIIIEESHYSNLESQSHIECIEGARACPPEDVGGVSGYDEFCSALNDSNHEEHNSNKEWFANFPWYERVFDSEKIDIAKVNYELMKYLRWSRNRYLSV